MLAERLPRELERLPRSGDCCCGLAVELAECADHIRADLALVARVQVATAAHELERLLRVRERGIGIAAREVGARESVVRPRADARRHVRLVGVLDRELGIAATRAR